MTLRVFSRLLLSRRTLQFNAQQTPAAERIFFAFFTLVPSMYSRCALLAVAVAGETCTYF